MSPQHWSLCRSGLIGKEQGQVGIQECCANISASVGSCVVVFEGCEGVVEANWGLGVDCCCI